MLNQKSITSIIICLFAAVLVANSQQPTPKANTNCTLLTTKPVPDTGKFHFNTCIVVQLATYYSIAPGKYIELNKGVVNGNASSCNNNTAKLVIDFPCGQLDFDIAHTNDSKTFVKGIIGYVEFKNASKDEKLTFANTTEMFHTSQAGHYYRCNSEQAVEMKSNDTPVGDLMVSQFALEAFRDTTGTDFYQIAEYCVLDSPPVSDLVRIGVGVCLVALVAIVLVAYFIGRRRWIERSSYESV